MQRSRASWAERRRKSGFPFMETLYLGLCVRKYSHGFGCGVWLHHDFTAEEEAEMAGEADKNDRRNMSTKIFVVAIVDECFFIFV